MNLLEEAIIYSTIMYQGNVRKIYSNLFQAHSKIRAEIKFI